MHFKCLLFLLVFLLTSCAPNSVPSTFTQPLVSPQEALLTVYLSTSGPADVEARITLEEIAFEVGNVWVELDLPVAEVDYLQQKGRQQLIGTSIAPLGDHQRVRLKVRGLPGDNGAADKVETFILSLADALSLGRGESKCLFLDWQLASERSGRQKWISRFIAWGQGQILGGELLYVSCPLLNTIYVARIDTNQVVTSFAVPGPLSDIRLDNQQRLYILSTGRRSLYVYNSLDGRLVDEISLPAAVSPQNMILSDDYRFAYISDLGAGQILKIQLSTGSLVARVHIGHRPQRLIYVTGSQDLLAVVAPNSQQVFILNVDNLQTIRVIPVGMRPSSLLGKAGSLYVAESGVNSVAVFDPRNGRQLAKITVGSQPEYLLNVDNGRIYVANSGETSLSVLQSDQATAFRKVSTVAKPDEMVLSTRKRLLYVAHAEQHRLSVINLSSEKTTAEISLGGAPGSMAVLD